MKPIALSEPLDPHKMVNVLYINTTSLFTQVLKATSHLPLLHLSPHTFTHQWCNHCDQLRVIISVLPKYTLVCSQGGGSNHQP